MKIQIERCRIPSCRKKMTRLYARESGRFVPVGWWCRECGISQMQKSLTTPS